MDIKSDIEPICFSCIE